MCVQLLPLYDASKREFVSPDSAAAEDAAEPSKEASDSDEEMLADKKKAKKVKVKKEKASAQDAKATTKVSLWLELSLAACHSCAHSSVVLMQYWKDLVKSLDFLTTKLASILDRYCCVACAVR
jgi:hypothetical protein